jgi:hypothetical protein
VIFEREALDEYSSNDEFHRTNCDAKELHETMRDAGGPNSADAKSKAKRVAEL